MLSYSRSRGLFAGIALTGATLRPDHEANKELYGSDMGNKEILNGDVAPPAVPPNSSVCLTGTRCTKKARALSGPASTGQPFGCPFSLLNSLEAKRYRRFLKKRSHDPRTCVK